jgi:hypothetical protein
LSLAKTLSHGEGQKRDESLEWELTSSGGFSVADVEEIVVGGLEGRVVVGKNLIHSENTGLSRRFRESSVA